MTMQPGPCARKVVTATIITPSGRRFVGTNHCNNAQAVCPRGDMPTGVGYEMCRDICQQPGHAEMQALVNAALEGEAVAGGVIYIEGHTYACNSCLKTLAEAWIVDVRFREPPKKFNYAHELDGGLIECMRRTVVKRRHL